MNVTPKFKVGDKVVDNQGSQNEIWRIDAVWAFTDATTTHFTYMCKRVIPETTEDIRITRSEEYLTPVYQSEGLCSIRVSLSPTGKVQVISNATVLFDDHETFNKANTAGIRFLRHKGTELHDSTPSVIKVISDEDIDKIRLR